MIFAVDLHLQVKILPDLGANGADDLQNEAGRASQLPPYSSGGRLIPEDRNCVIR